MRELHAQQRVERKLNPSARDQERAREMAEFGVAPVGKDHVMADPTDHDPEQLDDRQRNGKRRSSHHDRSF